MGKGVPSKLKQFKVWARMFPQNWYNLRLEKDVPSKLKQCCSYGFENRGVDENKGSKRKQS